MPGKSLYHAFVLARNPGAWEGVEEVTDWNEAVKPTPFHFDPTKDASWPREFITSDSEVMEITVKTLDGAKWRIFVSSDAKISEFKKFIADSVRTDHEQIRLIHSGLPLLDDKTFVECQIKETIVVVPQMRGS